MKSETERIAMLKELIPSLSNDVICTLRDMNFFKAPASTKYHNNYEGGLFDHSYNVAKALRSLTDNNSLKWQRKDSPEIVGMFHDLCKTDQYVFDGTEWTYLPNTLYKGHGDKSVLMLAPLMNLTAEEVACITYHQGAFTDKEKWNDYTRAIRFYNNVLWTHQADMIASQIWEVEQ